MKYYNKINRNLLLDLRLYFNKSSYNRKGDSTPRFYLKIVGLKGVERVAETHKAKDHGYNHYVDSFYGGKQETFLNDSQIDSILLDNLKKTSPYGYDASNAASVDEYEKQVKSNLELQSHYKTYWNNNIKTLKTEKICTKHRMPDGSIMDGPVHGENQTCVEWVEDQYMELDLHEIVRSKHLVKIPPASSEQASPFHLGETETVSCSDNVINIGYEENEYGIGNFVLNGVAKDTLHLGRNKTYTFYNENAKYQGRDAKGNLACVTGALPFRISTTIAGIGPTHTEGINFIKQGYTGVSAQGEQWHEKFELTITDDTPRVLGYYSPLKDFVNGVIIVDNDCACDDESCADPFVASAPEIQWSNNCVLSTNPTFSTISHAGIPDHCTENPDRSWNSYPNADNAAGITGQNYTWQIPKNPTVATEDNRVRVPKGPIGIARNGIPISNAFDVNGGLLSEPTEYFDTCAGRTDGLGRYHYIKDPKCLYIDVPGEHSPIIGYAFDGYPIYGPRDDSGTVLTSIDLDAHHGHEQPGRGYHYHITADAPYSLGFYYKGIPITNNFLGDDNNDNSPPPIESYTTPQGSLLLSISSGTNVIHVANEGSYAIGDKIVIGAGTVNEETAVIIGFGASVVLDRNLKNDHESGAVVTTAGRDNPVVQDCADLGSESSYKGSWASYSSYSEGDIVCHNSLTYKCVDSYSWDNSCPVEAWAPNTSYDLGELVCHDNECYIRIESGEMGTPDDGQETGTPDDGQGQATPADSGINIVPGSAEGWEYWSQHADAFNSLDACVLNKCCNKIEKTPNGNSKYWLAIGHDSKAESEGCCRSAEKQWNANTTYKTGDSACFEETLYACLDTHLGSNNPARSIALGHLLWIEISFDNDCSDGVTPSPGDTPAPQYTETEPTETDGATGGGDTPTPTTTAPTETGGATGGGDTPTPTPTTTAPTETDGATGGGDTPTPTPTTTAPTETDGATGGGDTPTPTPTTTAPTTTDGVIDDTPTETEGEGEATETEGDGEATEDTGY